MYAKEILEQYGFSIQRTFDFNGYFAFSHNEIQYALIPSRGMDEEELYEKKIVSDYMISNGIVNVASILLNNNQRVISKYQEQDIFVIKLPKYEQKISSGKLLASFHQKGLMIPFPPRKMNRTGQWHEIWATRLEQLESWWRKQVETKPSNTCEELFFETFPYFLGLSENAIQYVRDCQIDGVPSSFRKGTICLERFTPEQMATFVMPFELVYDHPVRDIGEWIRFHFSKNTSNLSQHIISFLNGYESILPLSSTDWRLLFGRLLFPLRYFELIEKYYQSDNMEQKEYFGAEFINLVKRSGDYEGFLGQFYQILGLPIERLNIPDIHWLKKNTKYTKFNNKIIY